MTKVLIVDDEKSIRVTLCEFLKKEGFEADNAADVEEALRMIASMEYDIIVSDIIMPRISGMELLERVRKVNGSVQLIIMTGEPTVDTAVKAVQNGANDYLIKPINRDNFIKAIKHAAMVKALTDQKEALEKQNILYQKSLENIVEQKTNELQRAMQSIFTLLSTVVEVRDPYTAGHQRRVGNLSAAIAMKMGFDEKTAQYLRIIGYIHDIGKITIPTEILSKPGELRYLELEMIRNHSAAAYEMLSKVDLPNFIGETIYQHHERCDGSGYPRGLKGCEILKEAKIIMIADVVEAMISHRPYRAALGLDVALAEINKNAGILYDEDIVLACTSLFKEDNYIIENEEYKTIFT